MQPCSIYSLQKPNAQRCIYLCVVAVTKFYKDDMIIKMFLIRGILTISILTSVIESYAQGPPVFTDTPILLGLGGRGVRTFGKYISKENANVYIQPLVLPFNITPKLLVGTILPFVSKSPKNGSSQSGFGDLAVFLKYVVQQKDYPGKTIRTLVKVTQRFPTGNNEIIPPLGTGAYQTAFGIVTGYITTKYGIYTELNYNVVSEGQPNQFIYNFAFSYPLLPQQYPPRQLNISADVNGIYVPELSNNTIFLSPGLQWILGRKVLLESGIQLPVMEDVIETERTKFMFLLGIRVLLF